MRVWRAFDFRQSRHSRWLGRALQGRLGVQAAQEHFQRQGRRLEVAAQQLQVGAGLA